MRSSPSQLLAPNLMVSDGNWLLHRAFSVMGNTRSPELRIPQLMLNFVSTDAVRLKATHVAVCFDGPAVFRYDVYARYKEGRKKNKGSAGDDGEGEVDKDSPYVYLDATLKKLAAFGIFAIQLREFEADDLMASFAHVFNAMCHRIFIVSRDKDLMGSVKGNVRVHYPPHKNEPAQNFDEAGVLKVWGLTPKQLCDYQTLIGDANDSIPPVGKVRDKSARKIIAEHGSLMKYFHTAEGKEFWDEHQEELLRNRKLVKMRTDALPKQLTLSHLKVRNVTDSEIKEQAQRGILVPANFYQLREMVHPRTKSLFG